MLNVDLPKYEIIICIHAEPASWVKWKETESKENTVVYLKLIKCNQLSFHSNVFDIRNPNMRFVGR